MTIWAPDLRDRLGPRYVAIADALARDIEAGRIGTGEKLPPQRELAYRLGVTVGTVSRAYREAERRGLVAGEVGRGTYVKDGRSRTTGRGRTAFETTVANWRGEDAPIDMKMIVPAPPGHGEHLARTLAALSRERDLTEFVSYGQIAGFRRHREVGARWIAASGLAADWTNTIITNGGHHAMTVVMAAVAHPGDLVVTERLTYPGLRYLANLLHLRLKPLAMDGEGLCPDAFEAACRSEKVRALYTVPTLHNPTAIVMPEERRRRIAGIASKYEVAILEDDVYGRLPPDPPPPMSTFAADRSYYFTSASKSLAGGLRVGFLKAPLHMIERLAANIRVTTWMTPPLNAEIVARWIEDGTADELALWHREEAARRQKQTVSALGRFELQTHPHSYHCWVRLPEPWRAEEFVAVAEEGGVLVTSADHFVVGRGQAPHAVRVCLAAESSPERLDRGLALLAELLADPARAGSVII